MKMHISKDRLKDSTQNKIFVILLNVTIVLLVFDTMGRFDGNSGFLYIINNHVGNFFLFALHPVIPSIWILYVNYQIYQNKYKLKKIAYILLSLVIANLIVVILSQFFNWYYYIDANNIYHRGKLFFVAALIVIVLVVIALIMVLINKKRIEKRYYFSLVFFAIPPLICVFLQSMFYGLSIIVNSIVISLLMVFFKIQNNSIYTDYLTGIYNRKKLDEYLEDKIKSKNESKKFSAIMIDLNNFKYINDTYGHDTGDSVLKVTAKLLKNCLNTNDFISRYGGDEFCIILEISSRIKLEEMVNKINNCFENYNELSGQPYKISLSMGYAIYDNYSTMKIKDFERKIDKLMYENKVKSNKKNNK
jgi:diguanylate cyclase (GGDEF)-like protein